MSVLVEDELQVAQEPEAEGEAVGADRFQLQCDGFLQPRAQRADVHEVPAHEEGEPGHGQEQDGGDGHALRIGELPALPPQDAGDVAEAQQSQEQAHEEHGQPGVGRA
jgi:hypothetical protein